MKVVLILFITIATALAEPPVNYLPPSNQYGPPSRPSSLYGAPGFGRQTAAIIKPSGQYNAPSAQYGAPSSQYGAPGGGFNGGHSGGYSGRHEEGPSEPANYNFEYHVEDSQYGTDFGHQEARQGDVAQGKYFVLLPDGRRQVVEYVADNDGYKPKISYEGNANNFGGGGGFGRTGYSGGGGSYSGAGGYSDGGNNGGYQY